LPIIISLFHSASSTNPLTLYSDDYSDRASLLESLHHFLAYYRGEFEMQIAERCMHFDFDPDLSTIFEELSHVLEQLTTDTTEPVYLDFFEQGTDLMLLLERCGAEITISFDVGDYAGRQFRDLPDIGFEVRANEFLVEWCHFVKTVLAALGELQPEVTSTAEFQDYSARLAAIEAQVGLTAS
jgi:hypothetical protein